MSRSELQLFLESSQLVFVGALSPAVPSAGIYLRDDGSDYL